MCDMSQIQMRDMTPIRDQECVHLGNERTPIHFPAGTNCQMLGNSQKSARY